MANVIVKQGDIIAAGKTGEIDLLVQQCNCLTCLPHGLSKTIAEAWPSYGNIYGFRTRQRHNLAQSSARPRPGTVSLHSPPKLDGKSPTIVALYAQWKPGKIGAPYKYPDLPDRSKETKESREGWFEDCLEDLAAKIASITPIGLGQGLKIGIPSKIGCGLAGGDWPAYLMMIYAFAVKLGPIHQVILYEFDSK